MNKNIVNCFLIIALASASAEAQNSDGFVFIKGGTFLMGSPESERMRGADETQHSVTVSDFYVDPYETTQASYEAVMKKNPSRFKGANLPVENVTWYDAAEYCNALSRERGLTPAYELNEGVVIWNRGANGYRLLTEAEWEYACRAGTSTIYNFGNQVHSDYANFQGSYPYLIEENYVTRKDPTVIPSRTRGAPIAADELSPNAFGLYNMHGNVSEWVFDYYGDYDTAVDVDPAGAARGHLRVNRGGGYNDFGKHLRSAYRSAANPIDADENLGFRICRSASARLSRAFSTTYDLDIEIPKNPRILIAYFSYSGNTANAARILQKKLDCDILELKMRTPYRGNIYDVSQRDLMNNARPPLAVEIPDIQNYDAVLLGYPTWWATLPPPVYTFLEGADFSGKSVFPFCSHGGTIFGDSVSDLSKAVPNSYVGRGFEFHYSGGRDLESNLEKWLNDESLRK